MIDPAIEAAALAVGMLECTECSEVPSTCVSGEQCICRRSAVAAIFAYFRSLRAEGFSIIIEKQEYPGLIQQLAKLEKSKDD
jgi:hypothetical protein